MKNILIANPKGGSGKTTLATNLASYFAGQGYSVILSDLDRQQSSAQWLRRRPEVLPDIHLHSHKGKSAHLVKEWLIVDSPAGLREDKLSAAVKEADCVIVPVQPSAFDIGATRAFLEMLTQEKAVRKNKTFVAMVGMRVNGRTHAAQSLSDFMAQADFPVLTYLRNAQVYVTAAEQGLGIFDMRPSLVEQDLQQWMPLLSWILEATDDVSAT
ncbi:MAG: ParA family protein [Methylotenera sp.]|nr:ParA family protein [Methylotenera sp.]